METLLAWPALQSSGDARVAEAEAAAISEKLVCCLWFDVRWRPSTLRTLDGRTLVVHSPGRWNRQAGPDFLQAVIEFSDGERCRGDVEIHRYASGWTAHRHHHNARYNQVMLHVILWNDRQATTVRRADGQTVPQVALAPQLPRPLSVYQDEIVAEAYPQTSVPHPGRCYEVLRALPLHSAAQCLERAGDRRLHQHLQRWARRATAVGLEQVMYEAVARALGAMGYRQHLQHLARAVPWRVLQAILRDIEPASRGLVAEAVLLGGAGLVPPQGSAGATTHAASPYIRQLQDIWRGLPRHLHQQAWQPAAWRQPHGRPANTPERRLAALAQLVARYHHTTLLEALLEPCVIVGHTPADMPSGRRLGRALLRRLDCPGPSYWTQHARLGQRLRRAARLIGTQRALTIVIDAVLPVLCLYARDTHHTGLQAHLCMVYQAAPRLPDNTVLRYMTRRLLGNDPALVPLVTGARRQQGLLQLFTDHCENDEGDCQGCDFPTYSLDSEGVVGGAPG